MSGIVIVTTSDLPALVRRLQDARPIAPRTAQSWAQTAGGPTAVLAKPVVISGRPVWPLAELRERLPRHGYGIDEDYAVELSEPPERGGRSVPGPAALIGIAEMAQLYHARESTIKYRRLAGTGRLIPAEAFTLGSREAKAADHKLSPVWVLTQVEDDDRVDRQVVRRLRSTNWFDIERTEQNVSTPWQEVGELTAGELDVGGDRQIGQSFQRRFLNAALPGAVVDVVFYVHAATEPPQQAGEFAVYLVTDHMMCRDVNDPGGTELWSHPVDDFWADPNPRSYTTVGDAEAAAQQLAREYDPDRIDWDAEYAR